MRAILHVGTYKTGTSSVQNAFYQSREALAKAGILYPLTGIVQEKGREELGSRHRGVLSAYNKGVGLRALSSIVREAEAAGCETDFLSNESWSSPSNLAQLVDMVTDFETLGFSEVSAIVALRNLAAYQVSHYRELTINGRNRKPYRQYLRALRPTFNYTLLLGASRSLFGDALTVLPFSGMKDARLAILEAAGLGFVAESLDLNKAYSNVKQFTALEYEAIRIANVLDVPHKRALRGLAVLAARDPAMFSGGTWTERDSEDIIAPNRAFMNRFAALSRWNDTDIDALFFSASPVGRSVSEVTDDLHRAIAQEATK